MKFAKPLRRMLAYLVDLSLLLLFMFFVYFFLIRDTNTVNDIMDTIENYQNGDLSFNEFINIIYSMTNKDTFIMFLLYLMYCFIYFVFIPMIFPFQTLGRFLFKIKVIKLNDTKLSFGTLFMREIIGKGLFVVFSFGIVGIISFIFMFTSRSGRSVHDRCSNTLVVEVNKNA